jgi:hypothetical protein
VKRELDLKLIKVIIAVLAAWMLVGDPVGRALKAAQFTPAVLGAPQYLLDLEDCRLPCNHPELPARLFKWLVEVVGVEMLLLLQRQAA